MGFYYDKQIKNKDYTIRLWGNGPSYDKHLATAIFNENFEFEVGNNWSNFDGGNAIENTFNSLKPWAGYLGSVKNVLKGMNFNDSQNDGSVMRAINKAMRTVQGGVDKVNDYLNKALVVQGTRFVYFSGTDIQMGNMMMRFTLFHEESSSVNDQLGKLMPYVIGDFNVMGEGGTGNIVDEALSMVGWQDPPGGFEASYKNVDVRLKGTVLLEFGRVFKIDNLVIKSASISMSKTRAKSRSGVLSPLYADVVLTLQPAGFISKSKLLEYTGIPKMSL